MSKSLTKSTRVSRAREWRAMKRWCADANHPPHAWRFIRIDSAGGVAIDTTCLCGVRLHLLDRATRPVLR